MMIGYMPAFCPPVSPYKRRDPLPLILVSMFLDVATYGMVAPLLPLLLTTFGGNAALAGVLAALYAGMQLLFGPVLGALSDRIGRKPVLLGCLLGTALSYGLLVVWPSLPMLAIAMLLDGITGGNLSTAYAYIADISTPQSKAGRIALAGAAFGLGVFAGPALGGVLAQWGLYAPLGAAALIALINATGGGLLLPESLPATSRATHAASGAAANALRSALRGVTGLITRPGSGGALLAILLANLAFSGLQTNFPLYGQVRFGWSAREVSYFFAFVGLCAVLTQGVLLRLVQTRLPAMLLISGGLGLLGTGLAALAITPTAAGLFPAAALAALGSGLGLPMLSAQLSNQAASEEQGRMMGAIQTTVALANIGAPLIAGAAFVAVGASAPYWVAAALAFGAALSAKLVPQK
jgi:MFS transporter, DHA1 family, tetracycline resistance protein